MTLRLVSQNSRTLNEIASHAQHKAAWLRKLAKNAADKLNRLAGLVTIADESLEPQDGNKLTLLYCGSATNIEGFKADFARIQKVLSATFSPDNKANVQFGRIEVEVELRYNFAAAQKVA